MERSSLRVERKNSSSKSIGDKIWTLRKFPFFFHFPTGTSYENGNNISWYTTVEITFFENFPILKIYCIWVSFFVFLRSTEKQFLLLPSTGRRKKVDKLLYLFSFSFFECKRFHFQTGSTQFLCRSRLLKCCLKITWEFGCENVVSIFCPRFYMRVYIILIFKMLRYNYCMFMC